MSFGGKEEEHGSDGDVRQCNDVASPSQPRWKLPIAIRKGPTSLEAVDGDGHGIRQIKGDDSSRDDGTESTVFRMLY